MEVMQLSTEEVNSLFLAAKRMACRYGRVGLQEPDDIVQATMIKLLKKDDGRKPTVGWLYKAVRSTAFDAGRSASRERHVIWNDPPGDLRMVCEKADELRYVYLSGGRPIRRDDIEIDLMPQLKNMLEELSMPLKQVLVLYSEGYSYQEIARLTNTNVGTVRSRLHYARKKAKSLLADRA